MRISLKTKPRVHNELPVDSILRHLARLLGQTKRSKIAKMLRRQRHQSSWGQATPFSGPSCALCDDSSRRE